MTDNPKPAGWYHAAGDPPGSHRYWDGARWQGEPRVFGDAAVAEQPAQSPTRPVEHDATQHMGQTGAHSAPNPSPGYAEAPAERPQSSSGYANPPEQPAAQTGFGGLAGEQEPAAQPGFGGLMGEQEPAAQPGFGGLAGEQQTPPPVSMAETDSHAAVNVSETKQAAGNFLSSLFDVSFSSFITNRAISVIYILVMVLIGLGTLFAVLSTLSQSLIGGILSLIIILPLALFYLVMMRMTLEFFVNQFRQTELMEQIAASLGNDDSEG